MRIGELGNATGTTGVVAPDTGGGLLIYNVKPTILRCTFIANKAKFGGGIGFVGSQNLNPDIRCCLFLGNKADDSGGGFANTSFSTTTVFAGAPDLYSCVFVGNKANHGE